MGRHGGGSRGGGGISFGGGGHHHHHHGSSFGHHHHHYGGGTTIVWVGNSVRTRPRCCISCILIIVIIIMISLIAGLAPKHTSTDAPLTAFETKLINPATSWYSEVLVTTAVPDFIETYKFGSIPPLGNTLFNRTETQQLSVGYTSYEFYAYNLLAGASVSIDFQLSGNMEFWVIKGDSDFGKWKDGDSVSYLKNLFTSSLQGYTLQIPSEDSYYFIWENTASISSVTGNVKIFIQSRAYDLSNYMDKCVGPSCSIPLDLGSSEVIIIRALDSSIPNDVFTATYQLLPRISYYWAIFGSIFGVVSCCVVVCMIGMAVHYFKRRSSYSSDPVITTTSTATTTVYGQPIVNPPIVTLENQPLIQPQQYSTPIPPPQYYPPSAPPLSA